MNKHRPGKKAIKRRPGRHEDVLAKRAQAGMGGVGDLAMAMGIGRNLAYEVAKKVGKKLRRRYLIPRSTIAKIVSGEITIELPEKAQAL